MILLIVKIWTLLNPLYVVARVPVETDELSGLRRGHAVQAIESGAAYFLGDGCRMGLPVQEPI